jgi:DNA topoisomerase-1
MQEISGEDFTAKDFRTWAGTVLAAMALQEMEAVDSETQAKHDVVQAIERVSERLGNTPAICRISYIHSAIIESYLDGSLFKTHRANRKKELSEDLSPEEAAVLAFLQRCASRDGT